MTSVSTHQKFLNTLEYFNIDTLYSLNGTLYSLNLPFFSTESRKREEKTGARYEAQLWARLSACARH